MISTQGKLWCEYPDAVIAAYLDHVQALSGARHAAVNGLEPGNAVQWLFPVFWWLAAKELILAWAMRRIAHKNVKQQVALAGVVQERRGEIDDDVKGLWVAIPAARKGRHAVEYGGNAWPDIIGKRRGR